MVFSSLIFLFSFLPFVLIGNFLWRSTKWQNFFLFAASLYFYAWGEKEKVFVMLASILVNYGVGIWIGRNSEDRKRNLALTVGIIVNLGILVYFKYSKFIIDSINEILMLAQLGSLKGFKYEKLPIGISFYTFQSISYLVDVYRREVKPQKNFIDLGLYIALFPQLIAGPIVRYQEIYDQLSNRVRSALKFKYGIKRFVIGLSKKMLVANPIGFLVDEIYSLPVDEISTPMAWLAIVAYAIQIYFDFSAYCDMAIGLGSMFGFSLPENFNFPYMSKSIREFWRRWHITLSVWFRDYLYIPIGGSRGSAFVLYRNLLIVFFTTGLWHGASWSFVVWGLFHGVFILLERGGLANTLKKLPAVTQYAYTLVVVLFAWVLFRIENIEDALILQKTMLGFGNEHTFYTVSMFLNPYLVFLLIVATILCFPVYTYFKFNKILRNMTFLKSTVYFILFIFSILEIINGAYNPFIYFRF